MHIHKYAQDRGFSFLQNQTIFLILALIDVTTSARILGVFMIEAFSHINVNNAVMETLAMAGHDVTIISSIKPKNPSANITYLQARKKTPQHVSSWIKTDFKSISWWEKNNIVFSIYEDDCHRFITSKEIQDILKTKGEKFDLMFTEILPTYRCIFPVAQRQNIPIIATSCVDLRIKSRESLGNPYHPSFITHVFSASTSRMSFTERLKNTIETMYLEFIGKRLAKSIVAKIYQKYYSEDDPFGKSLSLLFVNTHRTLFPQPHVPGIIEVGGIHLKSPQPLPKHLDEFISGAEQGVILFSLGTLATTKDLILEARQVFLNVFAKIPQRVIWKFGEHIDEVSDNVLVTEWIPQQDILAQENVVLFISHAGKSSSIEAVHTATPVLAIPLFADQPSVAANLKELGVGMVLDIFTVTEDSLLSSIQEMLQNTSYKDNARKLSRVFNDRPMTPKETVLYWTEYVLKYNGTDHLQTEAVNMPFYRYLLFDIILFFIITIIITVVFSLWVIRKAYSLIKYPNEIQK